MKPMNPESKKSVSDADATYSATTQPPVMNISSTTIESTSSQPIQDSEWNMNANYKKGKEAREALMRGVNLVYEAVAPTLGPKGKDAILEMFEWPYSVATNDGASIAERVKSDDKYEQMGVRLIQEAIGKANRESRDGSTTTCVLTKVLLEKGQEYVDSGEDLKKQLNECLPLILKSLDEQTRPIDPKDVWKVAAISAQDEEMGKMIGEIYQKIGKDGVVDWDNSHTEETTYEIKEGVELKGVSFVHRSMINAGPQGAVQNPFQGDRIIINNPKILITAEKINTAGQLEPYVSALNRQGIKELVVFCDEIEPMTLAEIEATAMGIDPRTMRQRESFKIIVLKAPTMWKDWVYEDFALMTGATVFGIGGAAQFKGAASLGWLGTCDKIVARRGGTDIIGTQDISEHIATLKEASKERREFEKRVEWLNSKSATVKMGARSEVELSYKRLKFDDAKNAAKLALQGGIVIGGGIALALASEGIENPILFEALVEPSRQIRKNGCEVNTKLLEENGIYDPSIVVKNAITAAISVAGTVLNCNTLLPLDKSQQKYG